jgi:hypothetical protein
VAGVALPGFQFCAEEFSQEALNCAQQGSGREDVAGEADQGD